MQHRERRNPYSGLILSHPLFEGLSRASVRNIVDDLGWTVIEYSPDGLLEQELGAAYLLLRGYAMYLRNEYNGARSIVDLVSAGGVLLPARQGVCVVVKDGGVCLELREPGKLGSLPAAQRLKLLENLNGILTLQQSRLIEKNDILGKRTLREKILWTLHYGRLHSSSDTFTLPLNRQELADYLYINRTSLSSMLGQLRDEGVIQFKGSSFTLKKDLVE